MAVLYEAGKKTMKRKRGRFGKVNMERNSRKGNTESDLELQPSRVQTVPAVLADQMWKLSLCHGARSREEKGNL